MAPAADDPVLDTLFLPLASGALSWPAPGATLFLRARAGAALDAASARGIVCEQDFKPWADALAAAGHGAPARTHAVSRSSIQATSSTLRPSWPITDSRWFGSSKPHGLGTRPSVGFMPTRPVCAAGRRVEPRAEAAMGLVERRPAELAHARGPEAFGSAFGRGWRRR